MKDSFVLSAPGKIFLAGEYLALEGGPSLLACLAPRFRLQVFFKSSNANPFHPHSPAGRLWQSSAEFFSNFTFEFYDPYFGQGGLGASTAQFALLHWVKNQYEHQMLDTKVDALTCLADYQKICAADSGFGAYLPSGADLVAQLSGQVVKFASPQVLTAGQSAVESFAWPFTDLGFAVFRTGLKIPTHTHLANLEKIETKNLKSCMGNLMQSFLQVRAQNFLTDLRVYTELLTEMGFVHPLISSKLLSVNGQEGLFVRGSGALGADLVIAFYDTNLWDIEKVQAHFQSTGFSYVANHLNLDGGVDLEMDQDLRRGEFQWS